MFGSFSKLLDRSFVLGFVLPALVLLMAGIWVGAQFLGWPRAMDFNEPLKDGTAITLGALAIAIAMMLANTALYRFLSGYRWEWVQAVHQWARTKKGICRLVPPLRQYDVFKKEFGVLEKIPKDQLSATQKYRKNELKALIRSDFPRESLLLLTFFGNRVRSSEDYAQEMYEFPAIAGWVRLAGVIPKDFGSAIDSARAIADLWVNLWAATVILVAEYLALATYAAWTAQADWLPQPWILPIAVGCMLLAYQGACGAAGVWGFWVRSAFDLYLPALAKQLGFVYPTRLPEQRWLWKTWQRALYYREPEVLERLDKYRVADGEMLSFEGMKEELEGENLAGGANDAEESGEP